MEAEIEVPHTVIQVCKSDWNWPRVLPGVLAILIGFALLPFSEQVWRISFNTLRRFDLLKDFLVISQHFVSPTVYLITGILIWTFDPPKRKFLPLFLIALLLSACITTPLKEIAGRARPAYSTGIGRKQKKWLRKYVVEHPDSPLKSDGSTRWLLLKSGRQFEDARYASFPSGHAADAFVFAAFLLVMYPRARVLWFSLAIGCSLSRIYFKLHFLEDTLVGGGIGWLSASSVLSQEGLMRAVNGFQLFAGNRPLLPN